MFCVYDTFCGRSCRNLPSQLLRLPRLRAPTPNVAKPTPTPAPTPNVSRCPRRLPAVLEHYCCDADTDAHTDAKAAHAGQDAT